MLHARAIVTPERFSLSCEFTNSSDRPCYLANRPPDAHCDSFVQDAYAPGANGTWLIQSGELLMLVGDAIMTTPSPFRWEAAASTRILAGQVYSFLIDLHAPIREFAGCGSDARPAVYLPPARSRATSRLWLVAELAWPTEAIREEAVDGSDAVRLLSGSTYAREQLVIDLPSPLLVEDSADGTLRGDAHAQMIREGRLPAEMQSIPTY